MPPKRSARLSASASKPPAAKKQKRGRKSSATVPREEVATPSTANVTLPAIPPDLVEQIVNRVADEVSRRMASGTGGLPSNTNALKEVPVIDMTAAGSAANGISPLVQGSINAVQKNLTGETVPKAVPDQLFISSSLPVDARVTDKIRAKICNQEYIDFGTLLANPVLDNRYSITVGNAESGALPSLCLEPVSKPKQITSIEAWTSCFLIFVGIYTSKYPAEAPALMKYGEIIQDLAARGHNWRYYDQNFRFLRQKQASAFPWGVLHGELWLRAQSPLTKKPQPANVVKPRARTDLPRVPQGFCFKFHRGLACSGCSFKHSCFKCSGEHRATLCTFRAPSKPSNSGPQSAKPKPSNPHKSS